MGMIKRALEELSVRLGHDGEITQEVLDHAKEHPEDFDAAVRGMRTGLGLPAVASSPMSHEQALEKYHALRNIVAALIVGINQWAADEDGIPSEMMPDYQKARELLAEEL